MHGVYEYGTAIRQMLATTGSAAGGPPRYASFSAATSTPSASA